MLEHSLGFKNVATADNIDTMIDKTPAMLLPYLKEAKAIVPAIAANTAVGIPIHK